MVGDGECAEIIAAAIDQEADLRLFPLRFDIECGSIGGECF